MSSQEKGFLQVQNNECHPLQPRARREPGLAPRRGAGGESPQSPLTWWEAAQGSPHIQEHLLVILIVLAQLLSCREKEERDSQRACKGTGQS